MRITRGEVENCCVKCGNYQEGWRCIDCGADGSFVFGFYDQLIGMMVISLKQKSARHLARVAAELMAGVLPEVGGGRVAVVPVPTIAKHRQERGLAHAEMVAKELARIKGWKYVEALRRVGDSVQTGKSREVRGKQAARAYRFEERWVDRISEFDEVIIYDDITTTGVTLDECAKLLRQAGARRVRRVVAARAR